MKLASLIQDLTDARVIGDVDIDVGHVRDDSRAVEPGDVFVAVRGLRADGHDYLATAVQRGAAAVVVEREVAWQPGGGARPTQVIVARTADALGTLAARAAGRPGDRLALVGITGTNGKTTTTFLIEAILARAGYRPGVIGTVSYRYGGQTRPAPYTTPTPLVLHRALADMAAVETTHAVLEVSSAALSMDRLSAMAFNVAAFTNLSQDHLDVHETMDAYCQAKARLFSDHLAADGVAVINADDPSAPVMIAAAGEHRVIRVSSRPDSDAEVRVASASSTIAGINAVIATPRGELAIESSALLGAYNVANIAMAVAICEVLGIDHADIATGIATMKGVPGRVERVPNDQGIDALVDYAHTPDALANVLSALKPLTRRRLICVFGCGGDRDPDKRPKMGASVAEWADLPIVTSDNPRTEDPMSIIDMILPGVPEPFYIDVDRRTAIQAAMCEATPGDIVLIAGKGHEDYQILGTDKIHFDDREEAARAIALRSRFPARDVLRESGGELIEPGTGPDGRPVPADSPAFSRVIIDGRIAAPGDLYVAIRGDRHDGHAFCAQAVAAGASGVVIDRRADIPMGPGGDALSAAVIRVEDGRDAFGAIARWHRRRWSARAAGRRIIGVTGSAGKTTTKDLIAAALSGAGRAHATRGSQNNETGVPLTLLGLRPYHDFGVVEMGMRNVGDIAYVRRFAEPTIGVVINAGIAHVGVAGSVEAIARGKAEMFADLPADTGVAVYPAGDPRLAEHARRAPRRITFGEEPGADVRLASYRVARTPLGAEIELVIAGARHTAHIPLVGKHNAINAACAVAAALAAGVDADAAVAGLARVRPAALRGEILDVAGRHILLDCYNANPASVSAALDTVTELSPDRAVVAVLGDMLELGDAADAAHREVGVRAAALGIDVISLGEHRAAMADGAGARGHAADSIRDAARRALAATAPGDWLLIKASRGMRLERVVPELRALAVEKEA